MPITIGHKGERVHYEIRGMPGPLFTLLGENKDDLARDFGTKNGPLPNGTEVYSRVARYGQDVYVHAEFSLSGALNPISSFMSHSAPRWFNDSDFLPLPPQPPVNRRSPTNAIARFAYSMAHMISSMCNGFMRWLSA